MKACNVGGARVVTKFFYLAALSIVAAAAAAAQAPLASHDARLPLLEYKKIPVQYVSAPDAQEKGAQTVHYRWTAEDAPSQTSARTPGDYNRPVPRGRSNTLRAAAVPNAVPGARYAEGVLHVFLPPQTDGSVRPFVLMFPIKGEPNFRFSRKFCRYFLDHGLRCAYFERVLPSSGEFPKQLDQIFALPGFPPHSVETARRGLDALEEMGILKPGDKIGAGGVSLGAIEAALLALTDARVEAAALILGGGDIPKILARIHGMGVKDLERIRKKQMQANGWTSRDFENEMRARTQALDPLVYLKLIPESRRLAADRFLMINVQGDPAIPNEASRELYSALGDDQGRHADFEMIHLLLPKRFRHAGAVLRLHHIEGRMAEHFKKYLRTPK